MSSPDFRRRHVRIFKGGGYVMADMVSMLRSSGLWHALSVTRLVHEADCVVAKARWNSGRHVNLEQVGAERGGITVHLSIKPLAWPSEIAMLLAAHCSLLAPPLVPPDSTVRRPSGGASRSW